MGGWPMVGTAWFQPTASLFVNVGFLIFIYRLEFHGAAVVKVSSALNHADNVRKLFPQNQKKKKFNVQLSKNVHVHFSGLGEWAQIIEVSETGLVVRMLGEATPENIQSQELELLLDEDTVVHLRCHDVFDDFYEFHFTHVTPEQLDQVQLWAIS